MFCVLDVFEFGAWCEVATCASPEAFKCRRRSHLLLLDVRQAPSASAPASAPVLHYCIAVVGRVGGRAVAIAIAIAVAAVLCFAASTLSFAETSVINLQSSSP